LPAEQKAMVWLLPCERTASAGLLDGSSRDSAFGNEQVAGFLVHINALATAAIAARTAHRIIEGRKPSRIREVNVGALL
jgi:hypothetical protein